MTDRIVPSDGGVGKTSTTLLARLRQRDAHAWRRFVHLYSPLVYRWCRQLRLGEDDAADVGQNVFFAVSRAITDFRHGGNGDTFRGWLRTITRNKVRDFWRKVPAEGPGEGGSDAHTRLEALAGDDDDASAVEDKALLLRRAVESLLAGCKEETREAFLRVVVQRQAPADVARDLGISVNAVYLARSRIRRQLRDEYADLLELD